MNGDRQDLRFWAAGGYVAAYCDLLIAVWDDSDKTDSLAGTANIVKMRLEGAHPKLISHTSLVGGPEAGVCWHVRTHRQKNPARKINNAKAEFVLLAPQRDPSNGNPAPWRECDLPACRKEEDPKSAQFRRSIRIFCESGANLNDFNQTAGKPSLCREAAFLELTGATKRCRAENPEAAEKADTEAQTLLSTLHRQASPAMVDGLLSLAALYASACQGNEKYDPRRGNATRCRGVLAQMLIWTFLGAVFLHLFSHWQEPHDGASAHAAWMAARLIFAPLAYLAAFLALKTYQDFYASRDAEKAHDCRALSEGIRVQFFWALAGLNASAAFNYMTRQRTEMEWIRSAVTFLAFPFERWRNWFRALPADTQELAFSVVVRAWIQEQADYHVRSMEARHQELHQRHHFGSALAIGGLISIGVSCATLLNNHMVPWLGAHPLPAGVAGTCIPAGFYLLWDCLTWCRIKHRIERYRAAWEKHPYPQKPDEAGEWQKLACGPAARCAFGDIIKLLTPGHFEEVSPRSPEARRRRSTRAFCRFLPMGILSALTVTCISAFMASVPGCPDGPNWLIVFTGAQLLGGALIIAWSEKNLLSEQAYQSRDMAELYTNSIPFLCDSLGQVKGSGLNAAKREAALDLFQKQIYTLGAEALDENAEWLILHRARPIEPVMAG